MAWTKVLAAIAFVGRVGLGVCLVASATPKILRPQDFLRIVYDYQLVSREFGLLIAAGMPWLELCIGVCLVIGLYTAGALVGALMLFVTFTAAVASALYRDLSINCGCFGVDGESLVSGMTLLRVMAFVVVTALLIGYEQWTGNRRTPSGVETRLTGPTPALA